MANSNRLIDGPATDCFFPVPFTGTIAFDQLTTERGLTPELARAASQAPRGPAVAWGIPFEIGDPLLVQDAPLRVDVTPFRAEWLVFMHTSDGRRTESFGGRLIYPEPGRPFRGEGRLNERAADYVIEYEDGAEARAEVRRRRQVGLYDRRWGENCFEAVAARKPMPVRAHHEQPGRYWGYTQTRVDVNDGDDWVNWLWAWQNPFPEKTIRALRFEPAEDAAAAGALIVSAVSAGNLGETPLRWRRRRKALLRLPEGVEFAPTLDENGVLAQIRLDLGQVISAQLRPIYPDERWSSSYNSQIPERAAGEVLVEYTSHPEAAFVLWDGRRVPVAVVESGQVGETLAPVAPAAQRVTLKVVEKGSRRPVAVRLHAHGAAGEYLAPLDRHRIINPLWFEDYSVDFAHGWGWYHPSTYIPGETVIDLPQGTVYLEISKGFEIRPVRTVVEVGPETEEIVIELEKALAWRERGWVTADTHVHFLSPGSAMLEGAAEGVNVVNLLASQWGELMTNVGDFDGRTTWGAAETGGGPQGDGEYLVRVGTENRQHVLGHISLLGYRGRIIAPMTTGGPDESALGDPVDVLLTEWARQCRQQGGLVVLPHFPNPRAEHAASIVSGVIDALEMTSWGDQYSGIDPYSLADWYRYLNCGYLVPAVGGTDKMSADTAVGTVRTYARLRPDEPFSYEAWMEAVRRAETFVTYGPLLDFAVDGRPMGSRLSLPPGGGALDVTWEVASVTVPVSRVELIVNGEIRESQAVDPQGGAGAWRVRLEQSAWLALLVRGHYRDKPEMVAAHSSPVMIQVGETQLMAAADAVTILEQIEGVLAYLESIGTRADDRAYRRMRLELQSAHRALHNRLHQMGQYHEHTPGEDHH